MSIAVRSIKTIWQGPLATGTGQLSGGSSGALDDLDVTWVSRTEQPGGKTSPEELAAAAHSSCFSMALSLKLGENKTPPARLEVNAEVALEEVDGLPTISTSKLTIQAQVPGIDQATFDQAVSEAAALCPVSRLFAGAKITVDATLVDS